VGEVLVRDVPDDVLAAIDIRAGRLGMSRSDYLRRLISQWAARDDEPVTAEDLQQLPLALPDLGDPEIMSEAWS
jgi:plasmid stability protein